MDEKRGIFIAIEGSDGSGKATQAKLIKEKLEAAGHEVACFDFPQYDLASSYFVKRYLDGAYGKVDEVGPYTCSLFYALDRFEAASQIRQALDGGKIVVSNRFTGSSMAHQGTKIAHAEQRRGFFIWLDNLEFEMLRIPRPDISFVLRVPAEDSKKLMAGRASLDIHETDPTHLARTVVVYDEMTQLFPKDFQRIDCVRSGQLLDIQTVNAMLWEKVNPLLPPPVAAVSTSKTSEIQPIPAETTVDIRPPQNDESKNQKDIILNNVSGLVAQQIERLAASARLEYGDLPAIYIPINLVPVAQKEYAAKTDLLLNLYAKLVAGLANHGISKAEALSNAGYALPVAVSSAVRLNIDDPGLEELVINLINSPLPEAQAAAADLLTQVIKIAPSRFKDVRQPLRHEASAVKALADEFLSANHIGEQPPVKLGSVWPRNEIELIADMLYEHSGLPLNLIEERVTGWPYSRKLAVFEAYIQDSQLPRVLEKTHYSWDLVSPYATFREIQNLPAAALEIQHLTPRYGYSIPDLVEEAGLSETFEKCFDLSLELYSAMQGAGHPTEAQYATLRGHSQRWKMTQNAVQALKLINRQTDTPFTQSLINQMREKLAEHHPIIAGITKPN